jgi:hypothetical protein
VGGAVRWGVDGFADALREGAAWVMQTTVGWWINVPSVDLSSSPATRIRSLVMGIAALVAVCGAIWCGIRMAWTRKGGEPLWDLVTGLLRLVAVAALAFVIPQLLLNFGDSFSTWALDSATSGSVASRMVGLANLGGVTAPGAVIFFAMVAILAGTAQAVLMFLREGAIIILSGVLVLAAAGGFNPATKAWFPKVSGWLLGLIFYKPMAALTYAAAFYMVGDDTGNPRTVIVGLTMLLLSLIALPKMMQFFSWAAPAAVSAGTGLGGTAAALGGAGVAALSMRGVASGGSAADQASRIRNDLGPVIPPGAGQGGGPAGPDPTPPPASPSPVPAGAGTPSPTAGAASSASAGTSAGAAAAGGGVLVVASAAKDAAVAAKDKAVGAMGAPEEGERR